MPGWHRVIVTARTTNSCLLFIYLFFSRHFLSPGKGAKYGRLRADSIFFGRPAAWFKHKPEKKSVVFAQKTPEKSTKKNEKRSDTVKGSHKHNCTDLPVWNRGSIISATEGSRPHAKYTVHKPGIRGQEPVPAPTTNRIWITNNQR